MKFILIAMYLTLPVSNLGEFNSLEDCKFVIQAINTEVTDKGGSLLKPKAMVCVSKGKETK